MLAHTHTHIHSYMQANIHICTRPHKGDAPPTHLHESAIVNVAEPVDLPVDQAETRDGLGSGVLQLLALRGSRTPLCPLR